MQKMQTSLGRLAVCLIALVLCAGVGSMGPAAQADESAPVAVAESFDSFYSNASYDITAKMLSNDTGSDSLVVCSVSKATDRNVKVKLKGGKVILKLLPGAHDVSATFTYQVCPQGDLSTMSEPVTDAVNVKHTYKPRFHKLSRKKMKVFNDNDLFLKVRLVWSNYYHVDKVFRVPPHGHVTVKRKHRVQDWGAWLGRKKIYVGYGTIR